MIKLNLLKLEKIINKKGSQIYPLVIYYEYTISLMDISIDDIIYLIETNKR